MTFPGYCDECDMIVNSDAEAFMHSCLHSGDSKWMEWGNPGKLNNLPFIFWPLVAQLMKEYKSHV